MFHFMKKPASSSLKARLLLKTARVTEIHDEALSSCAKVAHYLLTTYATDDTIGQAISALKSYRQMPKEFAMVNARKLYTMALRYKIAYKEKEFKPIFSKGWNASERRNMRVYFGKHLRAPLTELDWYTDTVIKIAVRNVTASNSFRNSPLRPAVKPNRLYAQAVVSDDGNGRKNTLEVPRRTWDHLYNNRR